MSAVLVRWQGGQRAGRRVEVQPQELAREAGLPGLGRICWMCGHDTPKNLHVLPAPLWAL